MVNTLVAQTQFGNHDLDDPKTTDRVHRAIIARKPFLRKLYREFYQGFCDHSDLVAISKRNKKPILIELGSGGGFLREIIPVAITSDVMPLSNIHLRLSGTALPFQAETLDGIFLLDTFHHIPTVAAFLAEADRCLKPQGRVVMMEPANTLWGRFIYRNFHHEAFEPNGSWEFESTGPLSSANGALPWIVFARDKVRFESEYPRLRLRRFQAHTPLRYLLSGGFSKPQFVPSLTYSFWCGIEYLLKPLSAWLGMFYWIVLEKKE
jgi:SAM-dependent methyltransferase